MEVFATAGMFPASNNISAGKVMVVTAGLSGTGANLAQRTPAQLGDVSTSMFSEKTLLRYDRNLRPRTEVLQEKMADFFLWLPKSRAVNWTSTSLWFAVRRQFQQTLD